MPAMMDLDLLMARRDFFSRADWTTATAAYVAASGIDMTVVGNHAGILTIIDCYFIGNGHFAFEGNKLEPAVVCEVYAEDDETTIDLCAWPVDRPGCFASLLGSDALGLSRVV